MWLGWIVFCGETAGGVFFLARQLGEFFSSREDSSWGRFISKLFLPLQRRGPQHQ